jgi:predicted GIY-YIG superfamily endonuclease
MGEHMSRACCSYSATRLPVELAHSQECPTPIEALNFERQIKGWSRAKTEALIRGDWEEISGLAKGKPGKPGRGVFGCGSTGSPRTERDRLATNA